MRDEVRIDRILEKIGRRWKRNSDLRFFQLAVALAFEISPEKVESVPWFFYIEDDKLEDELDTELRRGIAVMDSE